MPCAGKSVASLQEALGRGTEEESRGALWKGHPRRGAVMGLRMVYKRGGSLLPSL